MQITVAANYSVDLVVTRFVKGVLHCVPVAGFQAILREELYPLFLQIHHSTQILQEVHHNAKNILAEPAC